MLQNTSTEQEQYKIGKHSAMARVEFGSVVSAIDVRRNNSLKITATCYKANSDATFVYT